MEYIAHIRESDMKVQTVTEHLLEVRTLAEKYGKKLGIKYMAGLAGMLHDLGKYREPRNYIVQAVYHPEAPVGNAILSHQGQLFELVMNEADY